jgi:CheY-like chemotaxis protein
MSETTSLPLVLFVDDVDDIRAMVEHGMKVYQPAFRTVFAETADEALNIIASQPVAAAILDVNLLGESGATVAAVLHEHYPHIVKAFLTAYDRSVTHENAEEFGMEVLTKPITMPQLISSIYCLLSHRKTDCNELKSSNGFSKSPVSMPEVLRKITSSVFF